MTGKEGIKTPPLRVREKFSVLMQGINDKWRQGIFDLSLLFTMESGFRATAPFRRNEILQSQTGYHMRIGATRLLDGRSF
ncbi:MAG: hypothetical protein PHI56_06470 [Victivallaceae bacterium]|nr:hypothetical protein [Victivallaceae bacterium]MDD3703613.1 hypothetical protein [Victivallaceae bacterium]MDD5663054.1 hypothetical protein [Victivallaceae bacterium]